MFSAFVLFLKALADTALGNIYLKQNSDIIRNIASKKSKSLFFSKVTAKRSIHRYIQCFEKFKHDLLTMKN